MLHNNSQLTHRILLLLIVQLVQPSHQHIQLAARVHRKHRRETTSADRDGIDDDARNELQR